MSLRGVLDALRTEPALTRIIELASTAADHITVVSPVTASPLVTAAIAEGAPILVVTATGREAEDLAAALSEVIDGDVAVFPSWETLPHERLSPSSDTVGRRVEVLRRLATGDVRLRAIVASARAVMQPIPAGLGDIEPVELRAGDTADLTELVERLVTLGYERVDLVERRGQLAVRGGILDVFPPTSEHALRVEFWGDEVEEVRNFAVTDQRSLELADALCAHAVREVLLTPEVRARARSSRTCPSSVRLTISAAASK